jgi:ABC-type multidrug transport system fused ATPase/permease subunit
MHQEPIGYLIRKTWRFAAGRRVYALLYIVLAIVGFVLWIGIPTVFGYLLNTIQDANGITASNSTRVTFLICSILGIEVVSWGFYGVARVIEQWLAFHLTQAYRTYLVRGVFALPLQWHADHDSGETISKVTKATEGMLHFSKHTYQIIDVVTRVTVTFIILCTFNYTVAFVVLGLMGVAFVVAQLFNRRMAVYFARLQVLDNALSTTLTDALINIVTVKTLSIETPVQNTIIDSGAAAGGTYYAESVVNEWKWAIGSMIFTIITIVPLLVYVYLTRDGRIPFAVGTFTSLYLYTSNLVWVYFSFNGTYEEIMRDYARVSSVADIERAIDTNPVVQRTPISKTGEWNTLHIRDLTFVYDSSEEKTHLDQVSIDIPRGQHIAVIGSSGSGKTTFLKVLHGMYDTAKGEYAVDSEEYAQTSFANIDMATTLVPQEPEVFSLTVGENITLGMEYSDTDITYAIKLSQFEEVVAGLPRGLNSVVNEKGVNLSGGQKQRLALARALLFAQGKDILLLDESTSSVDPVNEAIIYQNIQNEFKNKTIIASIHKLNLLKYFDRILIFNNGVVESDGTLDQLLVSNPNFKQTWEEYREV